MKLTELFVQIGADTKGLRSGLAGAKALVTGFANTTRSALSSVLSPLGIGAGAVGFGGLALGLKAAVDRASDLNEVVSKTRAVFGSDAQTVISYAEEMAAKFGLVKAESMEAASQIGLIGKASGMTRPEAAALGVEFAKLAADLSSFHNVPLQIAIEKLRSGLVGEAEPLRQWGVLLSEAAVKSKLLESGLVRTKAEAEKASDALKVAARAMIIREQTADAAGDLDRTADGFANLSRQLSGEFTNAMARLGQELLPMATDATSSLVDALKALQGWMIGPGGASVIGFMDGLGQSMLNMMNFFGQIGFSIANPMGGPNRFQPMTKDQIGLAMQLQGALAMARVQNAAGAGQRGGLAAGLQGIAANGALRAGVGEAQGNAGGLILAGAQAQIGAAMELNNAAANLERASSEIIDAQELGRRLLTGGGTVADRQRDEIKGLVGVMNHNLKAMLDEMKMMNKNGVLGVAAP